MSSRLDRITNWEDRAEQVGYRVTRLAREAEVTPRQLERYFRHCFGYGPSEWLEALRLRRAKDLRATGHSVKESALTAGYRDSSGLWRLFRRRVGRRFRQG
jgi:AraC family transcriptional activator FtrA